jgi:hypothetical protein
MKTVALVASVVLHFGALSAIPANDAHETNENADVVQKAQSSDDSCKCDLEITEDCSVPVIDSLSVR